MAVTFYQRLRHTRWLRISYCLFPMVGWWRSQRTVFTFRSWLDLLDVVLALRISILKISKLLQNCWHRVIDNTSFEKHLESSLNCAPLLVDIFLYSYEAEFIQSLLSAGKKRLASQFNFTYRYIDDVLSINNPDFENFSVRCTPLSLKSKTRRRATLLLPTWICSSQSVETVNFALPFTTNVTISISILQTFHSWVATSHLRPPMAFLSHNSSDTPGLAPLMNVLIWGRCDFPISFLGRDMSRNVWNHL